MKIIFIVFSLCATLSAQADFYPTFKTQEAVDRYFKEDPAAVKGKGKEFAILVDEKAGKIEFSWMASGKKIKRTKFLENRVLGKIECRVSGDTIPMLFCYQLSFDPEIKENFISWDIASLCQDPKRFATPGGKIIRIDVDGFHVAVLPGFTVNPGTLEGHPAFVSGNVSRREKKSFINPVFTLEYRSYCLPRVVPCRMSGSRPRPEIDSPFSHETDPEFLTGWWYFLQRNKLNSFSDERRKTLGPGLDAEKASAIEMIDELIYNVQVAKADNWIPWAEGGEPLMSSLQEIKGLVTSQRKKELPQKLDEAMQRLESLKGKGRSEFYPMVRTYIVFIRKKAAV